MSGNRRKKLLYDQKALRTIILTAVMQWCSFLVATTFLLLTWQILTGWQSADSTNVVVDTWQRYGPLLIILLTFIPVLANESIRMSNRFAGPMMRLRTAINQVVAGERVEPLKFREGDFGFELARDFNVLLEQIQGKFEPEDQALRDADEALPSGEGDEEVDERIADELARLAGSAACAAGCSVGDTGDEPAGKTGGR